MHTYVHDEQLEEGEDVFGGGWRIVDLTFVGVRVSHADRFWHQFESERWVTIRTVKEDGVGDTVPRVLVVRDVLALVGDVAAAKLCLSVSFADSERISGFTLTKQESGGG